MAQKIEQTYPDSSAGWQVGGAYNYAVWARESNKIATGFVYAGLTEGEEPSEQYEQEAFRIAERRVAWAGYRLARLLNEVWP